MTTEQGLELGQIGMEWALQARANWVIKASEAIESLIASGKVFTSDDLIELVGLPGGSNRALGALLGRYSKARRIEKVGFQLSTRASRHGGYIFKWKGIKH